MKIIYALDEVENVSLALQLKDKIDYIKVHSVYYILGKNKIEDIGLPIFYDFKLYDTPNTVYNTIKAVCSKGDIITVTFAYNNFTSLKSAYKASEEVGCELAVCSSLTSAEASFKKYNQIKEMCNTVALLGINSYVVVSYKYIPVAKSYKLRTITPGIVCGAGGNFQNSVNTSNIGSSGQVYRPLGQNRPPGQVYKPSGQRDTVTYEEFKKNPGDCCVIGRAMPELITRL